MAATRRRASQPRSGGKRPTRAAPDAERVTPERALERATATHLAGERVDMGTLARELGIGRATLYRWFGSRERLLEEILLRRIATFMQLAREQAPPAGDERLIGLIRAMIESSAGARPVQRLIEREPTLALRILAGEHGRLHEYLVEEAMRDLAETRGEAELRALRDRVDATIQLVTALLWVAIAIGDEPPLTRIEGLARELLAEHPARRRRKR